MGISMRPITNDNVMGDRMDENNQHDWLCGCCNSYNLPITKSCKYCGASIGSNKDYFNINDNDIESRSKEEMALLQICDELELERAALRYKHKRRIIASVILAVIVLLILTTVLIVKSVNIVETVTVEQLTWEYQVDVEENTTVQTSDWVLPSYGRLISKEWKIKDDIKGIYGWYYTYEYDSWEIVDTLITSGSKSQDPYYGEVELDEFRRIENKTETYIMVGSTGSVSKLYNLDYLHWSSLLVGDSVRVKVNNVSNEVTVLSVNGKRVG